MEIFVNGQPRLVADGLTLTGLLQELEITVRHVAVEVNGELVPRGRHAEHQLSPSDRLEVVTLVGGG
jgi:sulfur carrier protein